jgi:hypothetical protein
MMPKVLILNQQIVKMNILKGDYLVQLPIHELDGASQVLFVRILNKPLDNDVIILYLTHNKS